MEQGDSIVDPQYRVAVDIIDYIEVLRARENDFTEYKTPFARISDLVTKDSARSRTQKLQAARMLLCKVLGQNTDGGVTLNDPAFKNGKLNKLYREARDKELIDDEIYTEYVHW